jgi:hypothetical protein
LRTTILALATLVAFATPTLAQTKVEDIGPNADRDFWCGAAFGVLVYTSTQAGDTPGSETASTNMTALFTSVATAMQSQGLPREDYDTLVTQYTIAVMDPFARSQKSYTREECDAAAAEAVAAMPAPPATPAPAQ